MYVLKPDRVLLLWDALLAIKAFLLCSSITKLRFPAIKKGAYSGV